jgi:phenylpyruvate tautomerase PptA (4-oxalocrotonate tautomerase family)
VPIYTCTSNDATFTNATKAEAAREIATIHSSINHVPSTYVNVVFHELPTDNVYTDGAPASPILVTGWVREGHPDADTTRLATEIAAAVTRITGVDAERVIVVMQHGPARFAVEGGRVLPEPGHDQDWIKSARHPEDDGPTC